MLFEKFKTFIEENNLVKEKEKLMLGVSGGPDSVFLLIMFSKLKELKKIDFITVHFNHSLRKSADREEEFVRNLSKNLNIKFVSEKKEVKKLYKGDSLEQTARNLRYDFFLKIARRYKIKKLALAHHKDDLVETVLLRIFRGTGLLGLRAILPLSKYKNLTVIRPLLFLEKREILDFLSKNKIPYMVDKSNFENEFLRNKIRLDILPYLAKTFPNIKENLYNLAVTSSQDYEFISSFATQTLEKLILKETHQLLEIDLNKLKTLPQGLVNNILRAAIQRIKGNLRRIELKHIDKLSELIKKNNDNLSLDIPFLKVIKQSHSLIFKKTPNLT